MRAQLLWISLVSLALCCVFVSPVLAIEFLSVGDVSTDALAPQHDESCVIGYQQTAVRLVWGNPPGEIFDDLHLEDPGDHQLCGFDMRMREISDGSTVEINFYENDNDAAPNGVVVAGPFFVELPSGFNGTVHVEVQDATIPQNVWMGMKFGAEFEWAWGVAGPAGDASIGTSHDILYFSPGIESTEDKFEDLGDDTANTTTTLYTTPIPVQTETSTWGRLKSTYR